MKGEECISALNTLLSEKKEILGMMSRISKNFKSQPNPVEENSVDSLIITERIQLKRLIIRLQQIEESVVRIERGVYGICSCCGEDIPQKRLEVLPGTNLCIICACHAQPLLQSHLLH